MSCNYADGLSQYNYKGILGAPEKLDDAITLKEKCKQLADIIKNSKHVVVHTGAGISTSAGIPDFRGPNGVWTLEEKGLKPEMNMSFTEAVPTKTHMALKLLTDSGIVKYVVSQNIDGLHLKSGMKREYLAELHGNMFIEQCNVCKRQFIRSSPAPTVGQKYLNKSCSSSNRSNGRPCRGKLHDVILDWEHSLPDDDLDMADMHSSIADLSICLGTTLQIVPSGNIPLNSPKYGGKLVICNLQPTKHDNKADLIINAYVDNVMEEVINLLDLKIPRYVKEDDPSFTVDTTVIEWTISKSLISEVKAVYKKKCDGVPKKRVLVKSRSHIPLKAKKSRKTYYIEVSESSESDDSDERKDNENHAPNKSKNIEIKNEPASKKRVTKGSKNIENFKLKNETENKIDLTENNSEKSENLEVKIESQDKPENVIDLTKNDENLEVKNEPENKLDSTEKAKNLELKSVSHNIEMNDLITTKENSTTEEVLDVQTDSSDVTSESSNKKTDNVNTSPVLEKEPSECIE